MDEMESGVANLSLEEEEGDSVQFGVESVERDSTYEYCFVGSFLTSSVVHASAMISTLANVCHPIGGDSIEDLEEGRFLFRFYLEVDVDRIIRDGPCTFNSHLLILHRLRLGENLLTVELCWIDCWLLIHDIPFGFMSEHVAKQLGNFIGSFIEYDTKIVQSGRGRIMCVRVKMNVGKPLRRRKKFTLPNGDSAYVRFEYEKLSLFCFLCGKLGDSESFLFNTGITS